MMLREWGGDPAPRDVTGVVAPSETVLPTPALAAVNGCAPQAGAWPSAAAGASFCTWPSTT
jgi:hypothetical protein